MIAPFKKVVLAKFIGGAFFLFVLLNKVGDESVGRYIFLAFVYFGVLDNALSFTLGKTMYAPSLTLGSGEHRNLRAGLFLISLVILPVILWEVYW